MSTLAFCRVVLVGLPPPGPVDLARLGAGLAATVESSSTVEMSFLFFDIFSKTVGAWTSFEGGEGELRVELR